MVRLLAWLRRDRARHLCVRAGPDDTLLHAAAVLRRRLGARITRYDVEARWLEARLTHWRRPAVVRVSAREAGPAATRVTVESDALGFGRLVRAFARDLALVERR